MLQHVVLFSDDYKLRPVRNYQETVEENYMDHSKIGYQIYATTLQDVTIIS